MGRRLAVAILVVLAAIGATSGVARAATDATVSGPQIVPSATVLQSGQPVDVTFENWRARLATISVCGNLARRGSADCNQVASQGVTLKGIGVDLPLTRFVVSSPPTPCPCVLRAVGVDTREVATVQIELVGHPIAPVVEQAGGNLVDVTVDAKAASTGLLGSVRTLLGGPAEYDVTVSVRNLTAEALTNVAVFSAAGHDAAENQAVFELDPGEVGPNQTWTTTTRMTLPALVIGDYVFQAKASGAGPVVTATTETKEVPWLLFLLAALLVGDLLMIVTRWLRRRRERRAALEGPDEAVLDLTGEDDEVVPGARPEYVPIKDDLLSGSR